MFLNLTLASRHTSLIIASSILNLALAYLPCSRTLHMKYRLLPKDLITSLILLYEQSLINATLYSYAKINPNGYLSLFEDPDKGDGITL